MEEEIQESGEPVDFTEIKGIVRRRRWQFLVPFFCGWALIWGTSWMIPSTYRSGTLILVEQPSVPEKYVVSNIDSDIQQQLDSITEQILSRTRLRRIIDHLGLYAEERKHKSPDDLVEKMRKDIEIELSHGDDKRLSAFNIYYASRDPKMAHWPTSSSRKISSSGNNVPRTRPTSSPTSSIRRAQNLPNKKPKCGSSKIGTWASCQRRPRATCRSWPACRVRCKRTRTR
jgi:hypothetical protein